MSDRSFSALSQRAFDLQKPGAGPNEWASKIQAMKQQVEGGEEDDHKRLEEEIAAARQARLRRSLGSGSRTQTPNIPDQSTSTSNREQSLESDLPKSDLDRQSHQDTTLQKLMGRNNVYNPDKLSASTNPSDRVSLASFIGGSASGPKLNKHAPQPNAHDPTQFIQPDTSAPHPVFGKGGIAMPGLTTKKSFGSIDTENKSDYTERYHSSSTATPQKSSSTTLNELLKSPGLTTNTTSRNNSDINRRSFTATPKSPSPALAARYAEKFEQSPKPSAPLRSQTLQPTQLAPTLSQRKSFSSLPTSSTMRSDETTTPKHTSSSFSSDIQSLQSFSSNTTNSSTTNAPVIHQAVPTSPVEFPKNSTPLNKPSLTESRSLAQPSNIKPLDFTKKTNSAPPVSDARTFSTYTSPAFSSKVVEPAKDTPLKRLMEHNSVYNPDKKQDPHTALEQVPVSLAAFIGGSARGPRLNKHAPQPDAHDPTQFIQPDLSAPHPIFGRGGVAMPGMVTKKAPSLEDEPPESTGPSNVKSRWPPVAGPPGRRGDTRPVSPQKAGNRERTTSTPSVPQFSNVMQASNTSYISHVKSARSVSPSKDRERTLSTPSYSHYIPSRASSSPTPAAQTTVSPSYLARPIAPDAKFPSFAPQIPPATVPSPAFQKSPPPKDPTPSISRLKGRGFVQNMVKASVQLESVPASTPFPVNKSRPVSAGKGSVLDRWQASSSLASPTKSSPSPDPLSRPSSDYPVALDPRISDTYQTKQSLKTSVSIPSIPKSRSEPNSSDPVFMASAEPFHRSRTPGVGSGTTMVLIKPSKSNSDLRQASLVDELGVQINTPRKEPNPPDIPSTPKKPLIHMNDAIRPTSHLRVEIEKKSGSPTRTITPAIQAADEPRSRQNQMPMNDKEYSGTDSVWIDKDPSQKDATKPPQLQLEEREVLANDSSKSPPASPQVTKHTRIPSTGNRATVMELAMAMANTPEDKPLEVARAEPTPSITPTPRPALSQVQSEKRRSTYEKYSSIMLPPLKEEATPVPSPAGTLGRSHALSSPIACEEPDVIQGKPTSIGLKDPPAPVEEIAPVEINDQIIIKREDDTIPVFDLSKLHQVETITRVSPENQTISVDVLSIVANSAHPVMRNCHIFYETEILAVVHRSKSRESGLVSTVVWCWLGKQCQFKDREDKKLRELATRYGASPVMVHQLSEPVDLTTVLGGTLIIRQGSRSHWSAENTTMHTVRSQGGVIFVDEQDFSIRNLCSAFSYCFTILGTVYVWHGSGSVPSEQQAALTYARTLDEHMTPVEMFEGTSDEDEIFWMMLGDDPFAQADYWKFRRSSILWEPKIWRVNGENIKQPITHVEFISLEQDTAHSVYIIDCIWELFVVVGKDARGDRQSIRFALDVAIQMSRRAAQQCPFSPTVHALILPSKLPLDLQSNVRDLDEAWLNNGDIPDHMNIIPCNEALDQISVGSWRDVSGIEAC